MVQILTDALKERSAPAVAAERIIAVAVKRIAVRLAWIAVNRCRSGSAIAILTARIAAKAAVLASTDRTAVLSGRIRVAPTQIERVAFRSVVRIFNAHHGRAAVSRIAYHFLSTSPIHSGKT